MAQSFVKKSDNFTGPFLEIISAAHNAARAIPPAFPLTATVAVNPYLGQTDQDLAQTAALLGRIGAGPVTMERGWYKAKIDSGEITQEDLQAAARGNASLEEITNALETANQNLPHALPSVATLAAQASGIDWPGLLTERIGTWAAGYYDMGQALWPAARERSAYSSWRAYASHDLGPEIAGLAGFAAKIHGAPDTPRLAMAHAAETLAVTPQAAPTYFHALLHSLGGWGQVARWKLWNAELEGKPNDDVSDLLTIRLLWEQALYEHYREAIAKDWAEIIETHAAPVQVDVELVIDAILQEAHERAYQRKLAVTLAGPPERMAAQDRASVQAAFCIDVRSEVFRRAFETADPSIETIGFAGFFGLPLSHRDAGDTEHHPHLPVLLSATLESAPCTDPALEEAGRITARAWRAWGRFKQAAVSSFAFVEAAGPIYAGKLLQDTLPQSGKAKKTEDVPVVEGLSLDAQIATANTVLRAMSLTQGFAKIVLLAGHGANVTNNPHASALQCGACGGHTGEVSARVLASLLNKAEVRQGLEDRHQIKIPSDTLFLAGLHDTTTDRLQLFEDDAITAAHRVELNRLKTWLRQAQKRTQAERALRLPRAAGPSDIARRAIDWAEVRPEWALAGCRAFIAAPRGRTMGRDLAGQSFLHSYDWRADEGFGVLELILTAPVVVASWISLQYYGSVVAPDSFGAGNKLLHNVIGGFGVLEGNSGTPRVGLAHQSVHDGEGLAHDPLRLSVVIEAPKQEINAILEKHPGVQALFDNRWLHLFVMDDQGRMSERYVGKTTWEPLEGAAPTRLGQSAA